jgi:D-lyxose ketol-isomerase
MKRSDINRLVASATTFFLHNGWALPPRPRWDVTDFGLGDYRRHGLVLVNLAEEPEYCEKLMYARRGMTTPAHTHRKKKEDIICRAGQLDIRMWTGPDLSSGLPFQVKVSGEVRTLPSGTTLTLRPGERVTLTPGIYHEFFPSSDECIIGEVSTANDDLNDNFFVNPDIGRFPGVEEDEPAVVKLLSDRP